MLYLWEVATVGFGVPQVLLPPPGMIGARFLGSLDILWADSRQTFLKAVLAGYIIRCGSGFLVSILVDRIAFLRRGLLPLGNLVSAPPIVGIAPIMVMWFGFDWLSKAAVVVIMTFFPMLVNTVTGLAAAGDLERDLLRSYGAGYWQTLIKLRLPAAFALGATAAQAAEKVTLQLKWAPKRSLPATTWPRKRAFTTTSGST